MASAVPSTFYQKVKFVVRKSLITIAVGEDMVAMPTITTLMWKLRKMLQNVLLDLSTLPLPFMRKTNLKFQHLICPKILRWV